METDAYDSDHNQFCGVISINCYCELSMRRWFAVVGTESHATRRRGGKKKRKEDLQSHSSTLTYLLVYRLPFTLPFTHPSIPARARQILHNGLLLFVRCRDWTGMRWVRVDNHKKQQQKSGFFVLSLFVVQLVCFHIITRGLAHVLQSVWLKTSFSVPSLVVERLNGWSYLIRQRGQGKLA